MSSRNQHKSRVGAITSGRVNGVVTGRKVIKCLAADWLGRLPAKSAKG